MKHAEHDLQKACVQWFRMQHKAAYIFSVPNGGKRDLKEAVRLKSEGVVSGVADLFVMSPFSSDAKGMFIEMKTEKGKQSPTQKAFELDCRERGYNYAVCHSLNEFMKVTIEFLQ